MAAPKPNKNNDNKNLTKCICQTRPIGENESQRFSAFRRYLIRFGYRESNVGLEPSTSAEVDRKWGSRLGFGGVKLVTHVVIIAHAPSWSGMSDELEMSSSSQISG